MGHNTARNGATALMYELTRQLMDIYNHSMFGQNLIVNYLARASQIDQSGGSEVPETHKQSRVTFVRTIGIFLIIQKVGKRCI